MILAEILFALFLMGVKVLFLLLEERAEAAPVPPLPPRPVSPPVKPRMVITTPTKSQFVGPGVSASGKCQVCGDVLSEDLVACPACATLHHGRCWEYIRGRSTYACEATSRAGGR